LLPFVARQQQVSTAHTGMAVDRATTSKAIADMAAVNILGFTEAADTVVVTHFD